MCLKCLRKSYLSLILCPLIAGSMVQATDKPDETLLAAEEYRRFEGHEEEHTPLDLLEPFSLGQQKNLLETSLDRAISNKFTRSFTLDESQKFLFKPLSRNPSQDQTPATRTPLVVASLNESIVSLDSVGQGSTGFEQKPAKPLFDAQRNLITHAILKLCLSLETDLIKAKADSFLGTSLATQFSAVLRKYFKTPDCETGYGPRRAQNLFPLHNSHKAKREPLKSGKDLSADDTKEAQAELLPEIAEMLAQQDIILRCMQLLAQNQIYLLSLPDAHNNKEWRFYFDHNITLNYILERVVWDFGQIVRPALGNKKISLTKSFQPTALPVPNWLAQSTSNVPIQNLNNSGILFNPLDSVRLAYAATELIILQSQLLPFLPLERLRKIFRSEFLLHVSPIGRYDELVSYKIQFPGAMEAPQPPTTKEKKPEKLKGLLHKIFHKSPQSQKSLEISPRSEKVVPGTPLNRQSPSPEPLLNSIGHAPTPLSNSLRVPVLQNISNLPSRELLQSSYEYIMQVINPPPSNSNTAPIQIESVQYTEEMRKLQQKVVVQSLLEFCHELSSARFATQGLLFRGYESQNMSSTIFSWILRTYFNVAENQNILSISVMNTLMTKNQPLAPESNLLESLIQKHHDLLRALQMLAFQQMQFLNVHKERYKRYYRFVGTSALDSQDNLALPNPNLSSEHYLNITQQAPVEIENFANFFYRHAVILHFLLERIVWDFWHSLKSLPEIVTLSEDAKNVLNKSAKILSISSKETSSDKKKNLATLSLHCKLESVQEYENISLDLLRETFYSVITTYMQSYGSHRLQEFRASSTSTALEELKIIQADLKMRLAQSIAKMAEPTIDPQPKGAFTKLTLRLKRAKKQNDLIKSSSTDHLRTQSTPIMATQNLTKRQAASGLATPKSQEHAD